MTHIHFYKGGGELRHWPIWRPEGSYILSMWNFQSLIGFPQSKLIENYASITGLAALEWLLCFWGRNYMFSGDWHLGTQVSAEQLQSWDWIWWAGGKDWTIICSLGKLFGCRDITVSQHSNKKLVGEHSSSNTQPNKLRCQVYLPQILTFRVNKHIRWRYFSICPGLSQLSLSNFK